MIFYLGTHMPHWLAELDVPLFVSRRQLCDYRTPPRARGPWALDSGAFTELATHGRWTVTPRAYAEEVRRWRVEIGNLRWAAVMDWMCEAEVLRKTGLSLQEHQRRTLASYLELRALAPEVPWVPVLQGWGERDYHLHHDQYQRAGVDLASLPLVGIGSVCRRQGTKPIHALIRRLHAAGIRLHGFGVKISGLRRIGGCLASSDSLAWSKEARGWPALPGCTHANCNSCQRYALWWRLRLLKTLERSQKTASQAPPPTPGLFG